MPAFCSQCGTENSDSARFCRRCGNALAANSGPQTPPATHQSPGHSQEPQSYVSAFAQSGAGYPPPFPAPAMDYALWGNRVLAALIDGLFVAGVMIVLYIAVFFLGLLFAGVGSAFRSAGAEDLGGAISGGACCLLVCLLFIANLAVGLYNKVYLVSRRGFSIGQGVMKLKVVNERGELISQGTAIVRLLAQIGLSFVPVVGSFLDLLWPLWDEKRQTLHDKAVSTFVINNP